MLTEKRERNVSVALPPSIDNQIEYLAKTESRTKSYYLRRAIEQFLATYPEPTIPA